MVDLPYEQAVTKTVNFLRKAGSLLFITGAGISAESGLPTYRGIGGLYNGNNTVDGFSIEEVLSGYMLVKKPEITWKYIAQIEARYRTASFNQAHKIISDFEKVFNRVWVLTQNIDGFHQSAGSKNVIDIHGDMQVLICTGCGWQIRVKDYSSISIPPVCPECGAKVRPKVVFFGEMLDEDKIQVLSRELGQGFDMYFVIGTTCTFPYIQEPVALAKSSGKPVIEINPGVTSVSDLADIKFSMPASQALYSIWEQFAG